MKLRRHFQTNTLLTSLAITVFALACSRQTVGERGEASLSEQNNVELVGTPTPGAGASATSDQTSRATQETRTIRRGMLWYRITPHASRLSIQMRLLKPPPSLSLFLPGPWADQEDWSRHITIRGARSARGELPFTLQRELGRIDLETEREEWVELDYEIKLVTRRGDSERFMPQRFRGKDGVFAYAPTFLILPSERITTSLRDIPIEVNIPENWDAVSTWQLTASKISAADKRRAVHGYLVEDVHKLRDAFLAAGPGISSKRVDESLRISYDPAFEGDRAGIDRVIQEVLEVYRKNYGDPGPVEVLVRTPPSKHRKLLWGTGRRGGFVLELSAKAKADRATNILIAHEAFHLWNGHALVPSSEHDAQTRWFKEGVTQYVALSSLHAIGRLEERDILDEIAIASDRYRRQVEARFPPPTKAHTHYPYDRGLLLAMGLDAAIREDTGWSMGLQGWLRALLTHARQNPDWTYGTSELGSALAAVAGEQGNAMKLWRKACAHHSPLVLSRHFEQLGLHWLERDGTRAAKLVPLAGEKRGWRAMLTHH